MSAPSTMRVFIPLTIRKRNGRPKIVPPAEMVPDTGGVDPHVLKAIAKAWSWRRKLESGTLATIQDIAEAEGVTPAFIRRTMNCWSILMAAKSAISSANSTRWSRPTQPRSTRARARNILPSSSRS